MKIVFVSNYMNVHQEPLCKEFIKAIGYDNFHFVACNSFDRARAISGYVDMNDKPFVVKAHSDIVRARQLVRDADIAIIMPYSNLDFLRYRLSSTDGLTFAYSERLLKLGQIYKYNPLKYYRVYSEFTKYRGYDNFQVLCASAFTSNDLVSFGFPADKCWKWGYFPNTPVSFPKKSSVAPLSLAWVGRLINWKRPQMALHLAHELAKSGFDFEMQMIGDGPLRKEVDSFVASEQLQDIVLVRGAVSNTEVQSTLSKSHIFISTSTRREGWGAVINEAMGNGCAPVAADQIGAVPYLIKHNYNGYIYHHNDFNEMLKLVQKLINNQSNLNSFGQRSFEHIASLWNARSAVKALLQLSNKLTSGVGSYLDEGPCSKAECIQDKWFH